MAKNNRKYTETFKDLHMDDEYEDFGYEIQNAKRLTTKSKRQTKFKDYEDNYEY